MMKPSHTSMTEKTQRRTKGGFFDKLHKRVREIDSLLCVGLDPHPEDLATFSETDPSTSRAASAAAAFSYCEKIVRETLPYACCYKPNSAFFEAFGSAGIQVLERVCKETIPADVPIILDVKRGDIGSTAEAYASAAFTVFEADAVTVSPYLGRDSLMPFLKYKDKGVFVLVKTSNESADELQALPVLCQQTSSSSDARPEEDLPPHEHQQPLYVRVAALCQETANARETKRQRMPPLRHIPDNSEFCGGSCYYLPGYSCAVYIHEDRPSHSRVAEAIPTKRRLAPPCASTEEGGGLALVAGAIDTHALNVIRAACPDMWILSPGVGAQGANLRQALSAGLRKDGLGILISVSRGIARAKDVAAEAAALRAKINEIRRSAHRSPSPTPER